MALEISEIGIRLAVGDPGAVPAAQQPDDPPAGPQALASHDVDELVRRCVLEVLATLRLMGER